MNQLNFFREQHRMKVKATISLLESQQWYGYNKNTIRSVLNKIETITIRGKICNENKKSSLDEFILYKDEELTRPF